MSDGKLMWPFADPGGQHGEYPSDKVRRRRSAEADPDDDDDGLSVDAITASRVCGGKAVE
jgi:hypothetical protein